MDDLLKPSTGGGGSADPLQAMRTAVENVLGKCGLSEGGIKAMLEVLDEHAPSADTRLPDDDEHAGRVREIVGDDELQKARDYLMGLVLSADDVERAIALARGDTGASDVLPLSGLRGGMGGAFGKTRPPGERFASDEYLRRFPNAVVVAPAYAPDRARSRPTSWPNAAGLADYEKRFGGSHIVMG